MSGGVATPTCRIIAPRQEDIVGFRKDGYSAECILPRCHSCPQHVIKTPEGKYFQWEDDYGCGCCSPDEDDRCYVFSEIMEVEAKRLLEGRE